MSRLAVLVLDADSRAGIGCVQSLGRLGHVVHLGVRRRGSAAEHSRHARAVHLQPRALPLPPAVAWLQHLHRQHDFALVIAATEAACRWLTALPEADALRQRAVLPSDAALQVAFDPLATVDLARSLGLPAPLADAPPVAGAGRRFGVQALCDRGRLAWHVVDEDLGDGPRGVGDDSLRRTTEPEPGLVEPTRRLLERLQWHGAATVQWRRDAGGGLQLEALRPVVSPALPLAVAAGVDLPRGLLALARGEVLAPSAPWRAGLRSRRLGAGRPHVDPQAPAATASAAVSDASRGSSGAERWEGWDWRDPGVAVAELRALVFGALRERVRRVARRGALAAARKRHVAVAQGIARGGPPVSVLFLCLGNLCRSPFAAAAAQPRLPGIAVSSAGLLRHDGRPSPSGFVATARALGVDLAESRARRVTAEQVAGAALIVCMDLDNLARLVREFPGARERTTLLGLFDPDGPPEVRDPYALPEPETRAVLVRMLAAIDALVRSFDAPRRPATP